MSEELTTVRLTDNWQDPNGDTHPKGVYLEVDPLVAKDIVAGEYGLITTMKKDEDARIEANRAAKQKDRDSVLTQRKAVVRRVHNRAEDDPRGGFKSIGHFVGDIIRAGRQEKARFSDALNAWKVLTKITGTMNEGDDAQGGFLVPAQFQADLLQTQIEESIVRQRATIVPMETNRVQIPAINDVTHASTTHGGITIYRPGEHIAKDPSKPAFHQVELTLHKLTGLIYVTDEIMNDSPISIEPLLNKMFGVAIAFTEDDDYINGTGINQALGFLNAPCLVSVAIEVGQVADTIVYNNITKMWSRLHPTSQRNAVWLANNDCFPEIANMALAVGTGGGPAYLPANGLSVTPWGSLMGRPLILTEKMDTIGDGGDIAVCDFSQYLIGQKSGGIEMASSMHFRFSHDEQTLRFVLRYDGQPWWTAPLTPKYSANTLSPFVTLDARP